MVKTTLQKKDAVKQVMELFHPKSGIVVKPPPDPRTTETSLKRSHPQSNRAVEQSGQAASSHSNPMEWLEK